MGANPTFQEMANAIDQNKSNHSISFNMIESRFKNQIHEKEPGNINQSINLFENAYNCCV